MDALHNRTSATEGGRDLLRRDIPTMADVFAAGGYSTAMFGKWHLGDACPYRPWIGAFIRAFYADVGRL